jgi:transposase
MDNNPLVAGIDVSKDTFNVHFGNADLKFSNSPKGFRQFLKSVPSGSVLAMEATGNYHYRLAAFMHGKGYKIMVLNPYKVKHWIISNSDKANDDKRAAMNITDYAINRMSKNVPFWSPMSPELLRARAIVSFLSRFTKIDVSCSNMNHAMSLTLDKKSDLLSLMPGMKTICKEQSAKLKKELCELVKKIYPVQYRLLLTIPGIGKKTAAVFCVIARGLTDFSNEKRLTSFVGLALRYHESGVSIRSRRKTSKTGNSYLRSLLYNCARAAIRSSKSSCGEFYQKLLSKGKSERLAKVAVMHKLVKIAFGVVNSGEPCRGGKNRFV